MIYRHAIEQRIGIEIATMRPLSGSMVGDVYRVDFIDGQTVVAKTSKLTQSSLKIEGKMLAYLAEHTILPVPDVLYCDDNLLIMSYIEHKTGLSAPAEEDAAHYFCSTP